jgi:hypothetical protein
MKEDYCKSRACIIAWGDTALETMEKKVCPKNGHSWGKPQVVGLKWKCTSMPTSVKKHDHPREYKVRDVRGEWHVQCKTALC